MPINKTLSSGSISMMLLKLISEEDMYGYQMIDTLRQRSQNVFDMKAGTLYPLLHELVAKGYVTTYEREANGKTRIYYSITRSGKNQLLEKRKEWETFSQAVNNVLMQGG